MGFPSVAFEHRVRHSRFIDKDTSFQDFAFAHRVCSWRVIDINQILDASTSEHTLSRVGYRHSLEILSPASDTVSALAVYAHSSELPSIHL